MTTDDQKQTASTSTMDGQGQGAGHSQDHGAPQAEAAGAIARKRSKLARNQFVILINFAMMLVFIAVIIAAATLYISSRMFEAPGPSIEAKTILIKPGTGIREIAAQLESQDLIRSNKVFVYTIGFENRAKDLKAGEYEIPAHASMRQIMDILVLGKSIEYSLTIPEGLTVFQAVERLKNNEILTGDIPQKLPPEGSLMATTISFTRGTTRQQVIQRLMHGQQKLVEDIWQKRDKTLPLKSREDMVNLASIVEKETGVASERPMIAGVFYNRMEKNMRLETDPTFLYGVYGGAGKPADKPVTADDRKSDTPYNTYRIFGLPPTPIAIPGKDALEAVANPQKTDALFFVSDGKGGHVFSKTFDEHIQNTGKLRQLRAQQKNENTETPEK